MLEQICRELTQFTQHPCHFIDTHPLKSIVYAVALNIIACYLAPISAVASSGFYFLAFWANLSLVYKYDVILPAIGKAIDDAAASVFAR